MNMKNKKIKFEFQQYIFIKKIKQMPFVEKIILFGSRARGDQSSRSDIDLAIVCPKADVYEWNTVLEIVEQADTLLMIDCVRFDKADQDLKENILKNGIEL